MRRSMVVLALAACSRSASPTDAPPPQPSTVPAVASSVAFPPLPKSAAEADDLVRKLRQRPNALSPDRRPFALDQASHDLAHAHAGEDDIAAALGAWLGSDPHGGYLLFGATHDSGAQVDAFRSIVSRTKGLGAVALEQLSTDDDADLAAFFRSGDEDARARLRDRQVSQDYAAWKFGYTTKIEDVVVTARGAGMPTVGCDMSPSEKQALPRDLAEDTLSSLRELRCALAMESRKTSVAALLGANHAERGGLQTFLPPEVRVRSVFFVGGRDAGFGGGEAGRLEVTTPFMLALDDSTDVLLLPDPAAVSVTRVRDHHVASNAPSAAARLTLFVSSDAAVTFEIAGVWALIGAKGEWLSLRATEHAFAFRTDGPIIMGGVRIPLGGWTELHLGAHSLEITEHEP